MVAHDVGPEFDDFRADNTLCRHGEAPSDRSPNRPFGLRVVDVRHRGSGQIAHNVGIIWAPRAVIALGPDRTRRRPQCAPEVASVALLIVAGVFMPETRQHGVTEEIADEVVSVFGAKSFAIALYALP